MTEAVKRVENRRGRIGGALGAMAVALAVAFAATPARADSDKHRGWHRGHGDPPGHARKHWARHGHAPVYVYAPYVPPPRVVYVPRPVYYAPPPQPGLTVVIPLHFD